MTISHAQPTAGRVAFVGASPGQADLITLRGAQRLAEARVVLVDALVDPALREMAPQARWLHVGKRGYTDSTTQEAINALLVKCAFDVGSDGLVVRLKGGDPSMFGRLEEELQAMADAGIACEVVPGVTAALAAAASAQRPLTRRGTGRSVSFATAMTATVNNAADTPVAGGHADTEVFYMAGRQLPHLGRRLCQGGWLAAVYAARALLNPVMIQGIQPGGQLTITTDVENYPGFADVIQGPWLMEQMKAQAEHVGTEIVSDTITEVRLKDKPIWLKGDSGQEYTCDALIICTGAQAKWLDLPSEQAFRGFGVSACATCDAFFYKQKEVIVVGGGNTAVEEALHLTHFASKVTVVHRRDHFRAEKILQDRLFKNPKVNVLWDTELVDVIGQEGPLSVTKAKLRNLKTGEVTEQPVHGIFIAIGHAPQTSLFTGQIELKDGGYIKTTPGSTSTSIPGVFAAGDVADDVFRQAVTAAGLGCMAALEAEKYLEGMPHQSKLAAE